LTPGLAPIGPTHRNSSKHRNEQEKAKSDRIPVNNQQPERETRNKQRPLEFDVIFCQPGIWKHFGYIRATLNHDESLFSQSAEQLGGKCQWTQATPQLMAQDEDHQHPQRDNEPPEDQRPIMIAILSTKMITDQPC